jgi:hypothetical protein
MKITKYILITIQLIVLIAVSNGQITLNRPFKFTGTGDSTRVVNLYTPNDTTAGLNATTAQSNKILFAGATGINNISLTTQPNIGSPNKGMVLYFKAITENTDSVSISLNGSSFYSLRKNQTSVLKAGEIISGQIVAAAFDGSNFQFLNYSKSNCPSGFLPVTSEYCIEINESVIIDTFYNAVVDCYSKNARMCNWGEWYNACVSMGAGLSNMTNNWEYTDDPGNEVNYVRIVGNGSCTAAGNQNIPVNAPKKWRCCYSLK